MKSNDKNGKTKLTDLNDHLFKQLNRLNAVESSDSDNEVLLEIERSKAVSGLAKEIVNNAKLALDAQIKLNDMIRPEDMPKMLK